MGFYDNYNFDGLKFFSQIKTHPTIAEPCEEFIFIVKHIKNSLRSVTIAEIGIGFGATTLQILKLLDANDTYYTFDFADKLQDFADDLQARDFSRKCKVVPVGNSHGEWDCYNWNLSNLIFCMRERNEAGIFDAVYLDGAHTFLHDGLAVCLLKELIKDGGFLILDDLFWTYSNSPTVKEFGEARMPPDQTEEPQILRVQEIFLTNDPNFERLSSPSNYRGIFRKKIL